MVQQIYYLIRNAESYKDMFHEKVFNHFNATHEILRCGTLTL